MALYVKAAEILEKAERKRAACNTDICLPWCETQKFSSILQEIIESTMLLKQTKIKINLDTDQVLVYDLVVGKVLKCGGAWKALMMKHCSRLQAALAGMKIKQKVSCNQDLLSSSLQQPEGYQLPRYLRVNTLKTTVEDAINYLKREGFRLPGTGLLVSQFNDLNLKGKSFVGDLQLLVLLVVSAKTDFHDQSLQGWPHHSTRQGQLSPCVLREPSYRQPCPGACTAPANKTSHLAAIMNNKGRLFAFDLDAKHLSTKSTRLLRTGVTCQQLASQDFLKMDPDGPQYRSKRESLCVSLSGMVCLQDNMPVSQKEHDSPRLKASSCTVSTTPGASFVCSDSTGSIHTERNEQVVAACLQQNPDFRLVPLLQQWPERGLATLTQCLRASTTKALALLEQHTAQSANTLSSSHIFYII
uniref:NOP2/Sun RNA methyltransferase 5 n=1 Tax=Hucho hucho TaxID=62062 RepID=A0A4W5M2M8_9TELE